MSSTPCVRAFEPSQHESQLDVRGANGSPVTFDGPMDFEKNDMMD